MISFNFVLREILPPINGSRDIDENAISIYLHKLAPWAKNVVSVLFFGMYVVVCGLSVIVAMTSAGRWSSDASQWSLSVLHSNLWLLVSAGPEIAAT